QQTSSTLPMLLTRKTAREEEQKREQIRLQRERLSATTQQLRSDFAPLITEGSVRMTEGTQGLSIEINSNLLFAAGDARIESAGARVLHALARAVVYSDFPLRIEGHTDNVPIASAQFPS